MRALRRSSSKLPGEARRRRNSVRGCVTKTSETRLRLVTSGAGRQAVLTEADVEVLGVVAVEAAVVREPKRVVAGLLDGALVLMEVEVEVDVEVEVEVLVLRPPEVVVGSSARPATWQL